MDIPDLVRERLGDDPIEATVSLGDEDLVCLTPTRTLVYRSEGLLSDESVSVYSHDVERLKISEGRRKTKFVLEYVDGTESFAVPSGRSENVLKLLLSGILHVAGIVDADESVSGVFRFSELTLVVTGARLVKHVGEPVFDADYEEFPYENVTGLEFEEGRVATQMVLTVDGRPQRIKAPNDQAAKFEQTLTQALFAYHEVDSLTELNDRLQAEAEAEPDSGSVDRGNEMAFTDNNISPLVDDDTTSDEAASAEQSAGSDLTDDPETDEPAVDTIATGRESGQSTAASDAPAESGGVDPDDIDAMQEQLSQLTTAVKRQNDLLRDQQETIDQLIEELRRGR